MRIRKGLELITNVTDQIDRPIVIDHIIAVCKGCAAERTFYPDANLKGA
jgi:hypothetical protein